MWPFRGIRTRGWGPNCFTRCGCRRLRESARRCWQSSPGFRKRWPHHWTSHPENLRAKFHRVEHHVAHLASTFYCSPFEEAALLSADGLGDFASSMWGAGIGRRMNFHGSVAFPHSLGLYYSAVTQYLGFLKFGDEYKVMGLARTASRNFCRSFATSCACERRAVFIWDWNISRIIEPGRR